MSGEWVAFDWTHWTCRACIVHKSTTICFHFTWNWMWATFVMRPMEDVDREQDTIVTTRTRESSRRSISFKIADVTFLSWKLINTVDTRYWRIGRRHRNWKHPESNHNERDQINAPETGYAMVLTESRIPVRCNLAPLILYRPSFCKCFYLGNLYADASGCHIEMEKWRYKGKRANLSVCVVCVLSSITYQSEARNQTLTATSTS